MPSSYAVQVIKMHEVLGETIGAQTVVYADSELEARTKGAAELGVDASAVRVGELGVTPSDAELKARQAEIREATDIPEYMRNVHE